MKRLLSVLLAIVIVVAVSVVGFSAEVVDSANGSYDTQTDISYEVYSTYEVTVPMYLQSGMNGEVTVNTSDVAQGYHVRVSVTNMDDQGHVPLYANKFDTSTQRGSVLLTVNNEPYQPTTDGVLYHFHSNQADNDGNVSFVLGFLAYDVPVGAGTYESAICFRFDCLNY